ncbi:dihydrofolate reductase [Actinomadura sp. CNU-125]|uniref:dihydrofolate reductase family protein n=1 Tax=Actinomadura sp. CNU-125 TaxID=1904961 RepID=UPI0009619643|nr:dihydrofolate reductase family protein [Actinomadura sp. CNU-125]OLT32943.1 dihydrofolate reductase [Actinomadura sp. CNU-125]
MRDLIVTENITLDGVIDATGGWFDVGGEDDVAEAVREQSAAADAVVFGRRTFDDMRGYWPEHADVPGGVGEYLDRVAKYVVSRTRRDPGWVNSTVLRGDLGDEIRALKERPGADIVTTGSITLVHALIAAGLVDEYRLFVHPVVLGRGARLFEVSTPRLRLVECRPFRSGVVLLRYRV